MKKLFAILLAAVMLLGMIGTAGAVEFTDAAEITQMNTEAVTVLSGMGIIGGMGDGTFQPDGTLTRAQAAKIIAYMMLGKEKAEALTAGTAAFTDVPTSHWACKYVNYCAEQGVVSGVGGGKFNPNGQLTGFQFGKMVLVAAGFNAEAEGLSGAEWDINVNKLLKDTWISRGVTVKSKEMSRQDACHLALNALFYGEDKDPYSTLAAKAFKVTRTMAGYNKANFRRPQYSYVTEDADSLWEGTELLVTASPFKIYNGTFTAGELYNDIGGRTFTIENLIGYRNGCRFSNESFNSFPAAGSTTKFYCSGPGVVTEFYYDAAQDYYCHIMNGHRAFKITAVTEPIVAANGTVMEHGKVTVAALDKELSCESDDFTEADIGDYAICTVLGDPYWTIAGTLLSAERAKIVTGVLQSDSNTLVVSGKTYTTLYATMVGKAQSATPYPADYIAGGGALGDTIKVALDKDNIAYVIWA
ncbi:MAG: S-layer homology domain-containing protein [Oscillospiraceae bacterium]|nr:S-layer homology domain-containing protein [Oscillospiraceae bacterium]